MGRRRI